MNLGGRRWIKKILILTQIQFSIKVKFKRAWEKKKKLFYLNINLVKLHYFSHFCGNSQCDTLIYLGPNCNLRLKPRQGALLEISAQPQKAEAELLAWCRTCCKSKSTVEGGLLLPGLGSGVCALSLSPVWCAQVSLNLSLTARGVRRLGQALGMWQRHQVLLCLQHPLLPFHTAVGALNSSWDGGALGCNSQGCDPGRWQQLWFTKPSLAFDPIPHFAKAPGFPLGKYQPESCWQPGTSPSALFRPHHWQ